MARRLKACDEWHDVSRHLLSVDPRCAQTTYCGRPQNNGIRFQIAEGKVRGTLFSSRVFACFRCDAMVAAEQPLFLSALRRQLRETAKVAFLGSFFTCIHTNSIDRGKIWALSPTAWHGLGPVTQIVVVSLCFRLIQSHSANDLIHFVGFNGLLSFS